MSALAVCVIPGTVSGDQQTQDPTISETRARAERGDADAQFTLGRACLDGTDVPQDHAQAVAWFRKAAAQGHAKAQNNLGVAYATGLGAPQDDLQAVGWYRKAAEQGLPQAQFNLGSVYDMGRGVQQDLAQAASWFRKAADQSDAKAQFALGQMYHVGRGVQQDMARAATWYRMAAEQGLAQAQFLLAQACAFGRGVPQDDTQAVGWYRKAAEQNLAPALYNLGLSYQAGRGVPQDLVEAHKFLTLGAEAESESGEQQKALADNREALARSLTAEQRAEADRRAREWTEASALRKTAQETPHPPGGSGQPGRGVRGGQNPQRGAPPPGPGLQTRALAGQPAAYHIFATGSRMGWASGLGQYSVGPADPSIVEHLQVAGEHMMWANRESYLPVVAWPNWTANRAEVRSWADDLVRDPRNPTRRQITVRASSRAATLADELRYQTMGTPEYTATCDAAYMRLGYELGYGQQVMAIADEAARNGDRALARQARQDGLSHLQNSSRILAEYEGIVPLTGRCADLRDVRTQLDAIYRLDIGDLSGQSRSTAAAWTLAIECIVALRGVQPAAPATPFFPAPPPPSPPQPPGSGRTRNLPQSPGSDPRDLAGMWFECAAEYYDESSVNDRSRPEQPAALNKLNACLRDGPGPTSTLPYSARGGGGGFMVEFTRNGDQYAGRVAAGSPHRFNSREPWGGAAFEYPPAGDVFRLTQTATGAFQGEMFDRNAGCVPGSCSPRWWDTRLTVDGNVARQVFPYFRLKIYWVRWPPQP